jgi:hypothetical protein
LKKREHSRVTGKKSKDEEDLVACIKFGQTGRLRLGNLLVFGMNTFTGTAQRLAISLARA